MNLSKNNWNLPPHKKLDVIADIVTYGAPLLSGAIMGLPLSDALTAWLLFPLTLLVAVAKILSRLSKDIRDANQG